MGTYYLIKISLESPQNKYNQLIKKLQELKRVAVAYSGGVDSTLLLFASVEALTKQNVIAIIVKSLAIPQKEIDSAITIATQLRVPYEIIEADVIKIVNETGNDTNRCYYCKKEIFDKIIKLASVKGFYFVVEGTNTDDLSDFRPGLKALKELAVLSPLLDANLTKEEIRKLSRSFDLPTWDKPSSPCLVTRFPYNSEISFSSLNRVYDAENFIHNLGFKICRVRHFENKAIVEVSQDKVNEALLLKDKITQGLNDFGYEEIVIDVKGYKQGKMNHNH